VADSDYVLISMTARNRNTSTYISNSPATGLNPAHISPIILPGVKGLDGMSPTVLPMRAWLTVRPSVRITA
jgi:beta-glucosidase